MSETLTKAQILHYLEIALKYFSHPILIAVNRDSHVRVDLPCPICGKHLVLYRESCNCEDNNCPFEIEVDY